MIYVIQEHHALKAGKHWDLRLEVNAGNLDKYCDKRVSSDTNEPLTSNSSKVLKSFVIPKCRLPEKSEKMLIIATEDHPWEYKDFEGEINNGYGAGTVKKVIEGIYTIENRVLTLDDKQFKMIPFKNGFLIIGL